MKEKLLALNRRSCRRDGGLAIVEKGSTVSDRGQEGSALNIGELRGSASEISESRGCIVGVNCHQRQIEKGYNWTNDGESEEVDRRDAKADGLKRGSWERESDQSAEKLWLWRKRESFAGSNGGGEEAWQYELYGSTTRNKRRGYCTGAMVLVACHDDLSK